MKYDIKSGAEGTEVANLENVTSGEVTEDVLHVTVEAAGSKFTLIASNTGVSLSVEGEAGHNIMKLAQGDELMSGLRFGVVKEAYNRVDNISRMSKQLTKDMLRAIEVNDIEALPGA